MLVRYGVAVTGHHLAARRSRQAVFTAAMTLVLVGCSVLLPRESPRTVAGSGVLTRVKDFCLGVDFEGQVHGVDLWPKGLAVSPDGASVIDSTGQVVLRAGDRIAYRGTVGPIAGDTSCAGAFFFEITEYSLAPT